MKEGLNQAAQLAQQVAQWIGKFLELIWSWSFGQIVNMFEIPFGSLPLWKQVIFLLVVAALVYLLWKVFKDLLEAVQKVLGAALGLFNAIINNLYEILLAGAVALGGAWIITTVKVEYLDAIKL